jgi:hypothetical protein
MRPPIFPPLETRIQYYAGMKAYHAVFGTGMRARTVFALAHGEVVRDV